MRGEDPYGGKLDPWTVTQRHQYTTPESATQFLLELLVQDDLDPVVRETFLRSLPAHGNDGTAIELRRLTHAIVTLPEFHLA